MRKYAKIYNHKHFSDKVKYNDTKLGVGTPWRFITRVVNIQHVYILYLILCKLKIHYVKLGGINYVLKTNTTNHGFTFSFKISVPQDNGSEVIVTTAHVTTCRVISGNIYCIVFLNK